jgi:hypothetical protein
MENELLQVDIEAIHLTQGSIKFNDYDRIKMEAVQLAEQIKTVEVNEENVKQSKKLLAVVNKRLKQLEDARISIKKTMLEPYQLFEDQVKEIVSIVKEADVEVRSQVKYLEEFERLEKEEAIKTIWKKRKEPYALGSLIPFDNFLKPKHLNKTTSVEAVEKEMIEFLEKTQRDYQVMAKMEHAKSYISAYLGRYDLAEAIKLVDDQEERAKKIEQTRAVKEAIKTKTFTVYDDKDYLLVELYMKNNNIKFTVKD